MKPISYKPEIRGTEKICNWEDPTGSCWVSSAVDMTLPFYLSLPTCCLWGFTLADTVISVPLVTQVSKFKPL